jgi:hypothetical protein
MALACRETPLQAVNMAKARTAREFRWCIFLSFRAFGAAGASEIADSPFASKRRRNTENSDTFVSAGLAKEKRPESVAEFGSGLRRSI